MSDCWKVRVDTGGTFTDAWARSPEGKESRCKILSDGRLRVRLSKADEEGWRSLEGSATRWPDGLLVGWRSGEGVLVEDHKAGRIVCQSEESLVEFDGGEEAPVVAARILVGVPPGEPFPKMDMRVATTRGTNALLERSGARVALFVNEGMEDLLEIRDQRRDLLFSLQQPEHDHLAFRVYGIRGRVTSNGEVIEEVDEGQVRLLAKQALADGCQVAAVSLMHAWRSGVHEMQVLGLLADEGFEEATASSEVAQLIRLLPRTDTVVTDAFLAPIMRQFVDRVSGPLQGASMGFMTSAGGLVPPERFHPKDSLLSGPAGGLIGAAEIGRAAGFSRVLTFDMGGTSTDVARLDGPFQYRTEQQIGPARVVAPALRIETVAAGGGSICQWKFGQLQVGPESAGSDPGPACYGRGGPLTLTDVNLLLGLMDPDKAGIPLDQDASLLRLDELIAEMKSDGEVVVSPDELLRGLRDIAVETMAEAIRSVSVREGVDVAGHILLAFGGAGPQHAAALAEKLELDQVLVPADAGLLSAWGLERAVRQEQEVCQVLAPLQETDVAVKWAELASGVRNALSLDDVKFRWIATLRLQGQESSLDVESVDGDPSDLEDGFRQAYQQTFGYSVREDRELELVALRVIGEDGMAPVTAESFGGEEIAGPSLIQDRFSTCVVPEGWRMRHGSEGTMLLERDRLGSPVAGPAVSDVIMAGLFRSRFEGMLEAMGEALKRTSVSTNVKDRMDYSCALLDAKGNLVASAPHVPVHLGALGVCVREVCDRLELGPGDVAITNAPGAGGSHLPDVTVIAPVHDSTGDLLGFVANRAHHAELGGMAPGSMPADAKCLAEEGVLIEPTLLVERGAPKLDRLEWLLRQGEYPSRRPEDNLADAEAQLAACHFARDAMLKMADTFGTSAVKHHLAQVVQRSGDLMASRLQGDVVRKIAQGALDDGALLRVEITSGEGRMSVDFTGSAEVHPGNLNATPAIVRSVLLYVLRLWLDEDVPLNEGLLAPVEIILPRGMLNPDFEGAAEQAPAVVGGNVETSQRLADVLLEALGISANGPGSMNNFLFGDDSFGYYETLSGGSGAGPGHVGASGRHVHMTNTALTDPELFEQRYPVRLWKHVLRRGSGGPGAHAGGEGVLREIEFLRPVTVSFLTQRRSTCPQGMGGGGDGCSGRQTRVFKDGSEEVLPGVVTYQAHASERVRIETPGGAAWGDEKGATP